jgi:hypothetical protein
MPCKFGALGIIVENHERRRSLETEINRPYLRIP